MQNTSNEIKYFEDTLIYEMSISTFLDGIGFYGPLLLIFIIMFALRNQQKYMNNKII